jgi:hypothetical protein
MHAHFHIRFQISGANTATPSVAGALTNTKEVGQQMGTNVERTSSKRSLFKQSTREILVLCTEETSADTN